MAMIQVTATELERQAEQLEQLNQNFKAKVEGLNSEEQQLCSMWEGEAKAAFDKAFQNDKTQMESFEALIKKYVQAMRDIAKKYKEAEAANTEKASTRSY